MVCALSAAGVGVVVLDPAPPHPRWPAGIHHVRARLDHAPSLGRAAAGCDAVFHVAGVWDSRPDGAAHMHAVNVEGTRAVLGLGLPVVYTSSSITCGFGSREAPGTEDEPSEDPRLPLKGVSAAYRASKRAAEALVSAAGGWLVNPDYVLGPGDLRGVVTGPLLRAARLPLIPAPRGGKCFVGVDDVAAGHLLAWRRARPARRYLLGAENLTYAEVFRLIAEAEGRRPPRQIPLPRRTAGLLRRLPPLVALAGALEQMSLPRYRSSARARTELGWQPAPVAQAIAEMLAQQLPPPP